MTYGGTIYSSADRPIAGATANFFSAAGTLLHSVPVTAQGVWQVDDETDGGLLGQGVTAVFSAPGYYDYKVSAALMPPDFSVVLTKKVPVEVVLGLGAAVALVVATKPGRSMIGAAEQESKKSGLPKWVLPLAAIGTGVALIWHFFNKPDPKAADSAKLADDAAKQLATLQSQGQITMLSDADLEGFSAQIVEATDDCGTDEEAIYNVFYQLFNTADFWALVKKFGVREIKSCFGGNYFGNTPYNLVQVITSELSSSELQKVNSILVDHTINYQF